MQTRLLTAIRAVQRLDSSQIRLSVFDDVASRSIAIRTVLFIYRQLSKVHLAGLLIGLYGAKSFFAKRLQLSVTNRLLLTAERDNEKKAVDYVISAIGDTYGSVTRTTALVITVLRNIATVRKYFHLANTIAKDNHFLPSCRVASTICFYLRSAHELRRLGAKGALVGSNYNPDAVGLTQAALSAGLPAIYSSHALISFVPSLPNLECDLAVLYGPIAVDAFKCHGPFKVQNVTYKGIVGDSRKLDISALHAPSFAVGIFLTAVTNMSTLAGVLEALSDIGECKEIRIRPHPAKIVSPDFGNLQALHEKVVLCDRRLASESASTCALVLAGNSSVHVDVLKSGIPTAFVPHLDALPNDYYHLVAMRILPELSSVSILSIRELSAWFDESWETRFREIDASYLVDESAMRATVGNAVGVLLKSATAQ